MTPQQAFAATVDNCRPTALLVFGPLAARLGQAWHRQHPGNTYTELPVASPNDSLPPATTHDLALIDNAFEQLSHPQGQLMLGQLRNFGTHRIAVTVSDSANWQLNDFLALGFHRQGKLDSTPASTLYTYNIDSYNRRRTWNNPQYWANPEMWDKTRW